MSCVVTNKWSDWSTQSWKDNKLALRVHKIQDDYVVRALESVTLSLPESIMETCSVVLTFAPVYKILWCDHSNETSLAVFLHGTICVSIFYKIKLEISLAF